VRNRTAEAAVDSSDGSFRTSSLCPRISTEAPKQNSRKRAASFLQRHPPLAIIDERQYATGLFQYLKRAADASRTRNGQFRLHRFREIPLAKTGLRIKGLRTSACLVANCGLAPSNWRKRLLWNRNRIYFGFPRLGCDLEFQLKPYVYCWHLHFR